MIDQNLRSAIAFIRERFENSLLIGAEVGVMQGFHALTILRNLPNIKLFYLIDPYLGLTPFDGNEDIKNLAKENLEPFKEKIRWVYKEFEACTTQDLLDSLDFIYLDANHAYEYVKQDLLLSTKLVKKGGVISGHDFGWTGNGGGVQRAVTEYINANRIPLSEKDGDWWFINV